MNDRLNLPEAKLKYKDTNNKLTVFDVCRSKYVMFTPEENVRQHFIHYLVNQFSYPKSMIGVEKEVKLNGRSHRADVIIYDKKGNPLVIIECKRPKVKLDKQAFLQVSRYNITLNVPYLFLTNGLEHFYFYLDSKSQLLRQLEEIPPYEEIT